MRPPRSNRVFIAASPNPPKREVVATLVDLVVGEAMGHDRIRAIPTGKGLQTETFDPYRPDLIRVRVTSALLQDRHRATLIDA
jgi:hypothetical protein